MIETAVAMAGIFSSVGIGAGLWYRMGKMEQKLDFIYTNCDITIKFKNGKRHIEL